MVIRYSEGKNIHSISACDWKIFGEFFTVNIWYSFWFFPPPSLAVIRFSNYFLLNILECFHFSFTLVSREGRKSGQLELTPQGHPGPQAQMKDQERMRQFLRGKSKDSFVSTLSILSPSGASGWENAPKCQRRNNTTWIIWLPPGLRLEVMKI